MDWKTFVAGMTASLAWPIAFVISIVLFRKQLRVLLDRIKKLGAGGITAELSDQVEKAQEKAELVRAEEGKSLDHADRLDDATQQLIKRSPDGAVLRSFKELEGVLLQIREKIPDGRKGRNLNEVMRYLNDRDYVSGSVVELFQSLRRARNEITRAGEAQVTPDDAEKLVRQIRLVTQLLSEVLAQLG
jgi:hypothetical protein